MTVAGRPLIVGLAWIEAHCVVPDGFRRGEPFLLYEDQRKYLGEFYRVRSTTEWVPHAPLKATAFVYRLGMYVGPQGVGKNPMIAAQSCLEGVGPALFAGWAGRDEGYACAEHGCGCGWEYPYDEGEPRGMRWPTPLIQITAVSQDSTDNTLGQLRPMIAEGPLADVIPRTGEELIRLPGGGRIDAVTSSAQARLGNPVTFAPQDEVGIWTARNGMAKLADTQGRGVSKMSGRQSRTTNAWDPGEHSVAQTTAESKSPDIYVQFRRPVGTHSFANKAERRKLFRSVYPPDTRRENGGHVDIDAIDAEAVDLYARDPAQARRFFGNEIVSGSGKAFDPRRWAGLAATTTLDCAHPTITIGFDGSRRHDHTSMIATCVACGHQWPLGIWVPENHDGEIPETVVTATLDQAIADTAHQVWRVYADPPYWETTVADWEGRFGSDRIVSWWTNQPKAMAYATRAWADAQAGDLLTHCPTTEPLCRLFTWHVENAVRRDTGYLDEDRRPLWIVEKERAGSPMKIDSAPAAILSWRARLDAIAAGVLAPKPVDEARYYSLTPR